MKTTTQNGEVEYNKAPDACPMCNHGIEPKLIGSNLMSKEGYRGMPTLQLIFRCPRLKCQESFIAYYALNLFDTGRAPVGPFFLESTAPFNDIPPSIPDEVKSISPDYVTIFTQAHSGERYKLDQIAGVGYRKSLEFLIKDFCIYKHANAAQTIEAMTLAQCINTYVDDINIKNCSLRATWLGNDETHFVKKWEEKDISDLKILIELTVGWIRSLLLTEKYIKEM